MIIEVKIFSTLRSYIPNSDRHLDGDKWDVEEGATVSQVLDMLNLPAFIPQMKFCLHRGGYRHLGGVVDHQIGKLDDCRKINMVSLPM